MKVRLFRRSQSRVPLECTSTAVSFIKKICEFPKCSVFRRVKRVVSSCVCLGGKLPPQLNRFFETAKERCKGFGKESQHIVAIVGTRTELDQFCSGEIGFMCVVGEWVG